MPAIKKVWNAITPVLSHIIKEVTTITAIIKNLQDTTGFIPQGSKAETWIETAIEEITGIIETAKPLSEKITDILNQYPTEAARDAIVFKIASLAAKTAHYQTGEQVTTQSFYDSAVQLRIIADKQAKLSETI